MSDETRKARLRLWVARKDANRPWVLIQPPPDWATEVTDWEIVELAPAARIAALTETLRDALDVAIWMSGSPTFSPEGEGHETWVNVMRPKLYAALAAAEGSRP